MLSRIDLRDEQKPTHEAISRLRMQPENRIEDRVNAVRSIIAGVRSEKDAALIDFTRCFDKVELTELTVSEHEIEAAAERIERTSPGVHEAITAAVNNVWEYHSCQLPSDVIHESQGLIVRELYRPLARAGCYVPGGRATYPSTVIMTAVPARVAGVGEITLVVPPDSDGSIPDVTLAAAAAAGVSEIHPVGGAQAIAALAYGTESIRPTDVIVGPGNVWVTLAQREVAGVVKVPSAYAGPSEVVVMADSTADPTFAAIDIILQAEHGPDGLAWLLTWDPAIADAVEAEVARLASVADRHAEIESTLQENGYSLLCSSSGQAIEVVNEVAPEHLELMVADPESFMSEIRNAGAIFCGPWTPSSLGDYAAGPNHVLPTNGTARFAGALGVRDFLKSMHVMTAEPSGLQRLSPQVEALAEAEGLNAHADSVRFRVAALNSDDTVTETGASGVSADQPGSSADQSSPSADQPGHPTQEIRPMARARSSIALMSGYHSPQIDVEIRLNTNESPYLPPMKLMESVSEAVKAVNWNRYPKRQATELRKRIAALYEVSSDQVFVANGSNEVLQSLMLAYSAAGGKTAVFEPTYAMHSHLARVTGSELVSGERLQNFAVDIPEAIELISTEKPQLTFLCSPNNPTGLIETPETISAILNAVRSVGGVLCVDEAYGEFTSQSALELLREDSSSPLMVTRTYSKAWNMAAIRLGYLIGPTWAVEELQKVVLPYHLDTLKQAIGVAVLKHENAMRDRVNAIIEGREKIVAGLAELPVRLWPSEANFVLFQVRHESAGKVWQQLVDRSVLVRDCSSWPHFENCLRVTVGTPEEIDRFLIYLKEVLT